MISKQTTLRSPCASHSRLTSKQERFVQEYAVDLNATKAAIRAGYSPKTARAIASENMQKPTVKKAIQVALRANEGRLQQLTDEVFAGPCIESVRRITRTDPKTGLTRRITSIKFRDRTKAFLELARRLGAY